MKRFYWVTLAAFCQLRGKRIVSIILYHVIHIRGQIGRVNLELQEEANELGYDTVQEAIADGWEANEVAATLTKKDELREAHEAWLKEKKDLLEEMRYSVGVLERHNYFHEQEVMERAIDFIEKGEV